MLSSFCYILQCLEVFLLLYLLSCSQARQKYLPLQRVPPSHNCTAKNNTHLKTAQNSWNSWNQFNLTEFQTPIHLTRGICFPSLDVTIYKKKYVTNTALLQQGQERIFQIDLLKFCPSTLTACKFFLIPPVLVCYSCYTWFSSSVPVIHAAPDSVLQFLSWACDFKWLCSWRIVSYFSRGVFFR